VVGCVTNPTPAFDFGHNWPPLVREPLDVRDARLRAHCIAPTKEIARGGGPQPSADRPIDTSASGRITSYD